MTRHQPVSCMSLLLPFLAAVAVSIAAWQCVRPAVIPTTPPATAMATPTLAVIVVDPTRPAASPPPHTPTPPEPLLLTPTATPVPPTPTATETATPTPEPTRPPTRAVVIQNG